MLGAALRAFAHRGFEGANMRHIAAEAGVDVALVSRQYGSKLALWRAVVDELAHRMDEAQADLFALHGGEGPVAERIRIALDRFVAFSAGLPELGQFFADEVSRPGERRDYVLERLWQHHRRALLPLLVEGKEAGILAGDDPELLMLMLIGAVAMPLMTLPAIGHADGGDNAARLSAQIAALFLRGEPRP